MWQVPAERAHLYFSVSNNHSWNVSLGAWSEVQKTFSILLILQNSYFCVPSHISQFMPQTKLIWCMGTPGWGLKTHQMLPWKTTSLHTRFIYVINKFKKKEKKTTKTPNKSKTTHKIPATCLYKICIKLRSQSSVCGIVSSHLAISDLFLRNILIKKLQHQLWCFTRARTSSLVAQCNSLLRLWEHSPCCLILLMTEYESTSSSHPTFLYHMPWIKNAIIFF